MEQDGKQVKPAELKLADIAPKEWTNAPTVMQLKQDLLEAKPAHDAQVSKIDEWLDNLRITGKAIPKTKTGYSKVQPKLIRKQAEWRYASLSEPFLATEDLFTLSPMTWEDTEAARQNSLVLNNQFNTKINKQKFIDTFVRAAVDKGTAIVKVAWEYEEEEIEVQKPIVEFYVNEQLAPLHQELAEMRESNPTAYEAEVDEELRMAHEASMEQGVPLEAAIVGYEMVKEIKILKNQPALYLCSHKDIIVDPSCKGDVEKAGFIIHRFNSSMAMLRKDGKYKNVDAVNVEANSPLNDPDDASPDDTGNFTYTDQARKNVVVYEYSGYYDMTGDGKVVPFVAAWVGDTLIRMEPLPFPDKKLPFVFVSTLPVEESLYGEPDGELLVDNQKIIGAVTRGMIDTMGRSANGQMGVRKDALDAVNRRKFLDGRDYEYNGNVDPRLGFHMHTYPEIPQSAQFMLQMENFEAESMSGVKAFSSNGINGDSLGKVATAVRGAIDATGKRETGILRRLAAGMVQIGRKIMALNAELLDDEEIIRVTNERFVAIRREDLAGHFDIRMDISTLEEDNAKAEEAAFMLQTLGPDEDPQVRRKILVKIFRLRKMPDLAKDIENYQPQPDPLEQEIKQLQIEKLKAEIMEIQSRAMENQSDAVLMDAKVDTEKAKAQQLSSMTDKQNLDFVEQESGVTQERDKELQGEQAKSNMQLEQFKRNLDREDESVSELKKYMQGK